MKKYLFFTLLFLVGRNLIFAQTFTLPVLSLSVCMQDLVTLKANHNSDTYYPAQLTYNNQSYKCSIRYRGASARGLPKPSWKIKFADKNNPWKVSTLNLSSDYRDISQMRNFLTMNLFHFMGSFAPNIEYVNLNVNNTYYGVFTSIEDIDDLYSKRNNLNISNLHKIEWSHEGIRIPFLRKSSLQGTWRQKIGSDYKALQQLDAKILFYSNQDFEKYIEQNINLDNWLNYFAIQNAVYNDDAFSKNMLIHQNGNTGLWEISPWDNDATFGNAWYGEYEPKYDLGIVGYNYLFLRLMEHPKYRQLFNQKVDTVIHQGFDYLSVLIDTTFKQIQNDVHQDNRKKTSNADFDAEMNTLKEYMKNRKKGLNGFKMWQKAQLSDFKVSTVYPSDDQTVINITIKSNCKQALCLSYSKSGKIYNVPLFDSGLHGDGVAGDSIYGTFLTVEKGFRGAIPMEIVSVDKYHSCEHEASRFQNMQTLRTIYRSNYSLPSPNTIAIGNVMKNGKGDYFVEISNLSDSTIDLSYCFLQNKYYENLSFPPTTLIEPKKTILLSSSWTLSKVLFGEKYPLIINGLFFDITKNDTLKIVSPDLQPLINKYITNFKALPQHSNPKVVINEINYTSSCDWFELYNPSKTTINISGYQITDRKEKEWFIVPNGTTIPANGYLVLAKNLNQFRNHFPKVNAIGNLCFGLGSKDKILIYDIDSNLVDSVTYKNKSKSKDKFSLMLKSPDLDNSVPQNWKSDLGDGSPGEKNK